MLNPAQVLFFFTLILGTLITFSSSSWFTAWLGLELNLLSFIPIISSKFNQYSAEASLKYFLIQALGSAIILSSAPSFLLFESSPNLLICLALLLKMGAAPVHFWFPSVMEGMNWPQCIILMTIQKVAPMLMLSYTHSPLTLSLIFFASAASSLIGSISGLNQTLIRKIMAYSSINHMAWMLAAIHINEMMWMTYFLVYSLISSSIALIMHSQQIFHFNQLSSHNFKTPGIKMVTLISFLSLGGLPPFLGFIPKWLVIQELSNNKAFIWLSILLISALITLFYYLRVTLSTLTLSSPKIKNTLPSSSKTLLSSILFINFFPIFLPLSLTFFT
uniref:NADH-ubiquinone oxidoreductase chain 2 n=1 Tax=Rimicaris kairei TaxID=651863 RepID=M1EU75_9EUCA|nr:NADH dehydrogenase subunit 2 [Rimicaris kairei]AEX32603.1 NADH dehydrogenase subunit 2 [Rimicaris kairei]WQG15287.1 NADH dehydrogenase subunit 2 [Rimicaris kairei]